jgi:hypothetical protein
MPFPRFFQSISCCGLTLALASACTTASISSPQLESRLAPEWIHSAQSVHSADRTIYFHGHAEAKSATNAQSWSGTISGDILVLDRTMAIVIPAGRFTLTPSGAIKVEGQQTIITSDSPLWKQLLHP